MMTNEEIERIVSQVVATLSGVSGSPDSSGGWIFDTMDAAITQAQDAQRRLGKLSLEERGKLIDAMRRFSRDNAEKLAVMA